jgi:SAM-dependent methyltransferase
VLKEIHRLLRPGGELIFSADSLATIGDPALLEKHRRDSEVVRYFGREELESLLRTVGFRDVRVKAIFCSPYARDLFSEGIRTRFVFGWVRPVFLYNRLRKEEKRFGPAERGLFLVARAQR